MLILQNQTKSCLFKLLQYWEIERLEEEKKKRKKAMMRGDSRAPLERSSDAKKKRLYLEDASLGFFSGDFSPVFLSWVKGPGSKPPFSSKNATFNAVEPSPDSPKMSWTIELMCLANK